MNQSPAPRDPPGFRWPLRPLQGLREIEQAAAERQLRLAQQQCRRAEAAMQALQQARREHSPAMSERFDLSRHVQAVAYQASLAGRLADVETQVAALREQRVRAVEFCLRSVRRVDALQELRAKAQGQYAQEAEACQAREGDAAWVARHGRSGDAA